MTKLALLNTLVYSRVGPAVIAFIAAAKTPGIRSALTSPAGLRFTMRLGVNDRDRLGEETIEAVQRPFRTKEARKALRLAGTGLSPKAMREVEAWLPAIEFPVRIIYGEKDRILPDVAKTMRRVTEDVPHAELTALPDCGHFLQEDRPDEVARLLAEFFAGN